MKKLKGLIILLCMLFIMTGCSNGKEDSKATEEVGPSKAPATALGTENASDKTDTKKIDVKIAALKGPTAIGMVQIMDNAAKKETANNYTFQVVGTPDEITNGLIQGDIDMAAVPCNLASVLYNKTQGKIKLAGINTLGVLYIVETGDTIHSVADLKGKTIYSTGFGTTPQYTLDYILKANGLDPEKDVTVEYKSEPTEVAAILSNTEDAVAMLPQPYVTTVMMNNNKLRIALDIAKEWDSVSTDGSSVVTGVFVVRKDFLDNNKAAVDAFLTEYAKSTEFVNSNIEEASALVEQYDIFKAAVAKQAIPYCNITLLLGDDMKQKVTGYLKALFDQNPKSIGGKMPEDDFFYMP